MKLITFLEILNLLQPTGTNIRIGAVDQQGHVARDPIILETELLEAGHVRKSGGVRKEPVWLKDYTP